LVGLGLGDVRLCCLCAGGERDQSLRWGILHHGGWGAGHQYSQMGRQHLVGLGLGDGRRHPAELGQCAGGERDQSLRRGIFQHRRRRAGHQYSQMGRQRLVGLGLGIERLCRGAGGERDRSLRRTRPKPRSLGTRVAQPAATQSPTASLPSATRRSGAATA